jgi:uncharacterized OB-fold protein
VPAVEGWFTTGESPKLLGLRDPSTGTFFFPPDTAVSRPPRASGVELEEVELSSVSPDPFEPYTVAAVELVDEQMVILGQVAAGTDPESLSIGADMRLVVETLYEDDDNEYVVWKWGLA